MQVSARRGGSSSVVLSNLKHSFRQHFLSAYFVLAASKIYSFPGPVTEPVSG